MNTHLVEFTGRLKASKHKEALDAALSGYNKCAAQVNEVKAMPNYSYIKYSASFSDGYRGTFALKMAEAHKGNEARIAELYNSGSNPDDPNGDDPSWSVLLQDRGKIGAGNPDFDEFVKKAGDITRCGPGTEEELAAVQFQFEFTPDAKSFSMTYINLEPWKRIHISTREDVLQYVFR